MPDLLFGVESSASKNSSESVSLALLLPEGGSSSSKSVKGPPDEKAILTSESPIPYKQKSHTDNTLD